MRVDAWRASLRIARRDAWRHKGRSLLVIALIGLPVLALGTADIAYRTWQLGPHEKLNRTLGSADGLVMSVGEPLQQVPTNPYSFREVGSFSTDRRPTAADVQALLPPGSRVIERRQLYTPAPSIHTVSGRKDIELYGFAYADPMARGLLRQVIGRAPGTTDEIAFTTALARDSGWHIGDSVQTSLRDRPFRLVGIVADAGSRSSAAAFVPLAVLPQGDRTASDAKWLVDTPGPLSWADVQRLNARGYIAVSRAVFLNPPPLSQVPFAGRPKSINRAFVLSATIIGGMALLEIVLLAGPAFAISARRQRRDLALIGSVGGRRRDLRNVVLANGVVLGVVAGLVAVALAVGLSAIGIATVGHHIDAPPGPFDVRPLELLALTAVSLASALAAAVFPARGAARTDVVATLAGRRGEVRSSKKTPVIGGLGIAGGVTLMFVSGLSGVQIVAGMALVEVGVVMCVPTLLGLVARTARWLPLSPRIALRDAGRNRSSAAPAIAAVMAGVIGCVAVLLSIASASDKDRRGYIPALPNYDGQVTSSGQLHAPQVLAAVQQALPGSRSAVIHGARQCYTSQCPEQTSLEPADQSSVSAVYGTIVDDGPATQLLLPGSNAVAALHARQAVVSIPNQVHNGQVRLSVSTADPQGNTSDKQVSVPAVFVPSAGSAPDRPWVGLIVPSAMAARLGVPIEDRNVYIRTAHRVTEHEQQVLAGALGAINPGLTTEFETGYHDHDAWKLLMLATVATVIALGASVIATALSTVDSRPDLITLASVGAAPRTRRLLATSRAGVIAGIGTILGTGAGALLATVWVKGQAAVRLNLASGGSNVKMRFVVPWWPLLIVVVAAPLLAMLATGAFTRSRLPSERSPD
jgi:putative ABC transport system permease protein